MYLVVGKKGVNLKMNAMKYNLDISILVFCNLIFKGYRCVGVTTLLPL
jgi:hypothetical protein